MSWSLGISLGSAEESRVGPPHSSSCGRSKWQERRGALLLSWVTRGARFCVPDSVWGPRGPEPHFENDSCPVKSSRLGSEKTDTTGSPAQSHRASGPATPHSSSSPGGPGWAVRTDDSGSSNSSLYLQVQPRRGNSLASGILLGDTGTDGHALPDWEGK